MVFGAGQIKQKGRQQTKTGVLPFVGFTPDDGGGNGGRKAVFTG